MFRKLKSLESSNLGKLGGRICAVVDLTTRYPVKTWFNEHPYAHESNFVEMVFRGIYHFTQALNQARATELIAYLTAPDNRDLGIVKSLRPKRAKPPLDLSPSPS